jgi:hypothetical protein
VLKHVNTSCDRIHATKDAKRIKIAVIFNGIGVILPLAEQLAMLGRQQAFGKKGFCSLPLARKMKMTSSARMLRFL